MIAILGHLLTMTEESKEVDPRVDAEVVRDILNNLEEGTDSLSNEEGDEEETAEGEAPDAVAAGSSARKKKSKRAKVKKALGIVKKEDGEASASSGSANPASKLTPEMVEQLLEMNPSLKGEVVGLDKEKAAEALKKLDVADLLTGMVRAFPLTTFSTLMGNTVGERKESEGHGILQVLADSTRTQIWSVVPCDHVQSNLLKFIRRASASQGGADQDHRSGTGPQGATAALGGVRMGHNESHGRQRGDMAYRHQRSLS